MRVVELASFADRDEWNAALAAAIDEFHPGLVVSAGFMRVLTPWFVEAWAGRMLNIHPSLLPLFRGTHTHVQALAAGVRLHGCTVHFVVPELDAGGTFAVERTPIDPQETAGELRARLVAMGGGGPSTLTAH